MDCMKKTLRKNKKRALSAAVTAAFAVTVPIHMIGCSDKESLQDDNLVKEEKSTTTSSGATYHRRTLWRTSSVKNKNLKTFSSEDGNDSDSNSKSNKKSNTSKSKKSSGYSRVKGGHFSS